MKSSGSGATPLGVRGSAQMLLTSTLLMASLAGGLAAQEPGEQEAAAVVEPERDPNHRYTNGFCVLADPAPDGAFLVLRDLTSGSSELWKLTEELQFEHLLDIALCRTKGCWTIGEETIERLVVHHSDGRKVSIVNARTGEIEATHDFSYWKWGTGAGVQFRPSYGDSEVFGYLYSLKGGILRAATVGPGGFQDLWEKEVKLPKAHSRMSFTLDPGDTDSPPVLAVSLDGTVVLMDANSGDLIWGSELMHGPREHVWTLKFIRDAEGGRCLYASSGPNATIYILDATSGALLTTVEHPPTERRTLVEFGEWMVDTGMGDAIVSGDWGEYRLLDTEGCLRKPWTHKRSNFALFTLHRVSAGTGLHGGNPAVLLGTRMWPGMAGGMKLFLFDAKQSSWLRTWGEADFPAR